MRSRLWLRMFIVPSAAALIGTVAVCLVAVAPSAAGATTSAKAANHPIRPGTSVTIAGVTCTAGAVLHQKSTVYIAIPASCAGVFTGKYQNGCPEAEAPIGTPADVAGARHQAILTYNSFTEMQSLGTAHHHNAASRRLCHYNDLALFKLNPHDRARVAGSIAGMHAPTSVSHHGPASGRKMTLGSHQGTAGASHEAGWVYDVTPSGSLSANDVGSAGVYGGRAFGMLTVLPHGTIPVSPANALVGSPAEVYSLHKALLFLRKTRGFHHVSLLAAGEHV